MHSFFAHSCTRATQLLDLQQNSIKDGHLNMNIPFLVFTCCTQLCDTDSYAKFGQIVLLYTASLSNLYQQQKLFSNHTILIDSFLALIN